MKKQIEFNWTTPDGLKIYAKEWPIEQPKAVIALVHGIGEHCNRYNHMARYFNQAGLAMISFDRRGEGRSEGKRGFTPDYEVLMEEIGHLLQEGEKRYAGLPVVLYGHSLGGNLVLNFLLRKKPLIAGVVVSGPWIQLKTEPPRILTVLAKLLKGILPSVSQSNGLNVDHISRDPEVVKAYIDDPYVHDRITFSLAGNAIESAEFLNSFKGEVNLPLLVMHGGADQICSCDAAEAFSHRVRGPITFKKWEGLYHEVHNEPEKKQVFNFTLEWLLDQF